MTKQTLKAPFMLETATYVGIATMALLGVSGLPTLRLQLAVLGLCLLFGLLFRLNVKSSTFRQNPTVYFGLQAFILTLVGLLGSRSLDAFNFLFLLLTIHTALVLPGKQAVVWIIMYYVIVIGIMFLTQNMNSWYAILFYLITYVVCGFFGYAMRQAELARDRNQHLVEELQSTQKKLQDMAVIEERNRLARDLHDSVKQQVFAISMQLSAARTSLAESDRAFPAVVEAERLAQQAGAELTTLIQALRPPGLESRTLPDAIQEYVQEWSRQNQVEAELKVDSTVSLGPQVEQALFRILQEALANVARHSQADKAWVSLKAENQHIELTVEDNGTGYDADRVIKGVGLDSMHERLDALNGTLQVSRRIPHGTCVAARVRRS